MDNIIEQTYQVTAPKFTAGFVVGQDGIIIRTAPILKWAYHKHISEVKQYFKRKHWACKPVD